MSGDMEADAVLAALVRALRCLGWEWQQIRGYTGLGFVRLTRLRREFGIEPHLLRYAHDAPAPPLGYSYPCWESDDAYDAWFVQNDPASPFHRR